MACSEDIFRTAGPFLTRHCVVVQHYELECRAKIGMLIAIFSIKIKVRAYKILPKYDCLNLLILLLLKFDAKMSCENIGLL